MIKVATFNQGTIWAICSDIKAECIAACESLGFEHKHGNFYCKGREVARFSDGLYYFDNKDDHRRYEVTPEFQLVWERSLPSVAWVKRHLCVYRLWLEEEQ